MKTKFHLALLVLIAAFSSCDKPIIIDDTKAVTLTSVGTHGTIIVGDGYTIKPSKNQIVVKFDPILTEEDKQKIREQFPFENPPQSCHCDNFNIESWTIDTSVISIEDAVKKLNNSQSGKTEGDRGFDIALIQFPNFQSSNPGDLSKFQVKPSEVGTANIAVIDTGLDPLYDPYLYDTSSLQDCFETTSGWNFFEHSPDITDGHGHGSAVTSIIASRLDANNIDFRILPLKVFDENGIGSYWNVVCAFAYIKEIQNRGGKIHIINASFGGKLAGVKEQSVLTEIIADISNKSVVISSAGNDGLDTDNNGNDHFISSYTSPNLLPVGGFEYAEAGSSDPSNIVLHDESNYGQVSIDVAAPYTPYIFNPGLDYTLSGTSYATALVTSVAAKIVVRDQPSTTKILIQEVKRSAVVAPKLKSKIGGQRAILMD